MISRRILFYVELLIVFCAFPAFAGPHTVQRGETYADIARLYHIELKDLLSANQDTEAHTGLTIDVPLNTLFYDLGSSTLFRNRQLLKASDLELGKKYYQKGHQLQMELKDASPKKQAKLTDRITDYYRQAVSYGSVEAFYQLGRHLVHGCYYTDDDYPTFFQSVNSNRTEFTEGIEYLQIASVYGERHALVELALACGYKASPIYNAYLCLEMLLMFKNDLGIPVSNLICYMYEYGYGINQDYMQAYLNCPSPEIWSSYKTTHKEAIIDKIAALPDKPEYTKYGIGFDANYFIFLADIYCKDQVMQPEGIYWLHRAAKSNNALANWLLAVIIKEDKYRTISLGDSDSQWLHFARVADNLGNTDAHKYVEQYDLYEKAKREQAEEQERQQRLAEERRKQERRAKWGRIAATAINIAAETALTAAAIHEQQHAQSSYNNSPFQGRVADMTASQFNAQITLAMQQLAQYTVNKGVSDWTGTPMIPTDMSAVRFGSDMSPGSPAWMFNQHQIISSMSMMNTRMACEQMAFLKYQTDQIEQQMIENPLQPIAGYYDRFGNWNSADMVAPATTLSSTSEVTNSYSTTNSYQYGDRICTLCAGLGICNTCNGDGKFQNSLTGDQILCPNCIQNGVRTGKCSSCHGTGKKNGFYNE